MNYLRFVILCLLILAVGVISAQDDATLPDGEVIENVIESILAANPELSEAQINDITDRLTLLAQDKVDLNNSDLRIFEELLLLNELQVRSIVLHRQLYGAFISLYELQSVPILEITDIRRIWPFLKDIGLPGVSPFSWKMLYKGSKTLLARYAHVLEEPAGYAGDAPKYLGSRDQVSLRLRHVVPGRVSIGVGVEKDAGEPLNTTYNPLLFDFVTFHVYLEQVSKRIKRIALGDFQVSAGQGLIMFSGYGFGRSAFTTSIKRNERSIRPSTSLNEINALRGAAVEVALNDRLQVVAFASLRKSDGTLIIPDSISNDLDEVISSLQMSGLHRTESEIRNKGHIDQITTGGSLKYTGNKLQLGLNAVYDHLSKRLDPTDRVYNRFYFKGKEALNASFDYTYYFRNMIFYGETAINPEGAIATVDGMLIGLHPKVNLAMLFRHLPKEYYSLHGKVFSDQSQTTNEIGFYTGLEIKPTPRFVINIYADFFRHDWPTFSANGPSEGSAYLIKASYQKRKFWDGYLQVRYQSEQVSGTSDALIPPLYFRHKTDLRLHFNKKVSSLMTWSSRFDYNFMKLPGDRKENGYLMYQELWFKPLGKPYNGFVRVSHFNIDSYQSRIYSYEHYQAYDSRNVAFEGVGNRLVTGIRWKFHNGLVLEASYNMTKYTDRDQIGSGNDKINGPLKSEIRAQIRYGFND